MSKTLMLEIGNKIYPVVDWEQDFSNKYHVVITYIPINGVYYFNINSKCTQACLLYTYDKKRAESFYNAIPESDLYTVNLSKSDRVLYSK